MKKTGLNELRKDPLLGRWIAVLSESLPPSEYNGENSREPAKEDSCMLCAGRESETPHEIMRTPGSSPADPSKKWTTRVIANFDPVFMVEGDLGRRGEGMYDKMNSIGANEIIIESPHHAVEPEDIGFEQMIHVVETYRARMADLEKDTRLRYTLIYKNHGRSAGALYGHPLSQLVSTPVIPKRVKEELDNAKRYFSYKERCIFCDIMREEMRIEKRVIIESRHYIAFCPYASKFPFETWILPKRHNCAFQDIRPEEVEDFALILSSVLKKLRSLFPGLAYNYFIHSAPNRITRKDHWHTLGDDYHWHLEIMPRFLRTTGFEWGSGLYILPTSPEHAAKFLREV
ncbi:MAG: galactose-1-phosphate uridylyltransferase [Nitrospirae bacterium]|nr:galactose-1-phosphate uridylyltransferase [Nitrospirota bacterium]